MLSCKDVTARVGDWTDGALPFHERLAVRLHLLICAMCRRFLRQYRLAAETAALSACQHHPDEIHAVLKKIDEQGNDRPGDQHVP